MEEQRHVFFDTRIKALYYTNHFISAFPDFIDWNWCIKNIKLTDYILLRNWNKFKINSISKYQLLSDEVIEVKKYHILWKYASKNKLSEKIMHEVSDLLHWNIICKYQKLTMSFIESHLDKIKYNNQAIFALARYQDLSEEFILKNYRWLPKDIISQFQNLSFDFIRQHEDNINMDFLSINKNYNKPNTIQILKSQDSWYIIDAPIIATNNNIKRYYCEIGDWCN
jgi:hypothetical protein